jgi:uncharacterized damage-inducible protein DinB
MKTENLHNFILDTWQTNNQVTEFFFENLPDELWSTKMPGAPLKTIRMVAGHIHNARCMWIKMIGRQFAMKVPKSVDRRGVSKGALLRALKQSNQGIIKLLEIGLDHEGVLQMKLPWANIPSDVVHFSAYMIAHEAHHRGQIVLAARALGHRLPHHITTGIWQWKKWNAAVSKSPGIIKK